MTLQGVVIVGASETTELGKIPGLGQLQLHADAALNALDDCRLTARDIDGVATAGHDPAEIAHYLGIEPDWVDGTPVGGCSFLVHLRHAAAAIAAGQCTTVLITHGESGRSGHRTHRPLFPLQFYRQFEEPYGVTSPPTKFPLPVLRYLKDTGQRQEHLAHVAVAQREWAARHPRAGQRDPLTVDDVMDARMIAYPLRRPMCCLVSDGGGALVVTAAERAAEFPARPVYLLGAAESTESSVISQMEDFSRSRAFRRTGRRAFAEAGIGHDDVDHLMIYDAFAHLPLYGLEDLGFVRRGEAGDFVAEGRTGPGGSLPMNTNGGGLSYAHSGMYGMFALQEGVRQMRGTSPAQVEGAEVSVVHGVGGMFTASATVVLSNVA